MTLLSRFFGVFLMGVLVSPLAAQDFEIREVTWELDETEFAGAVVWPAETQQPLPGLLMVPNWMGVSEGALAKARQVAAMGYVVMVVDMYGVGVRPTNGREASAAAGFVRADRQVLRDRLGIAHDLFITMGDVPLRSDAIGAIGFCFGGGAVLEYARGGASLGGVVSFHGDLLSPTLEADAHQTQAAVLVLHGAADPFVPQDHVQQWIDVMSQTRADWQLVQYSDAVHSFTDPLAAMPGQAEYHPRTARRAFAAMQDFFGELFGE
jgi:dienelactone hydrolase